MRISKLGYHVTALIGLLLFITGMAQTEQIPNKSDDCLPAVYRPAKAFVQWEEDPVYSVKPPFHTKVGDDLYFVGDILHITSGAFQSVVHEMNASRTDISRIVFDAREIVIEGPISVSHAELIFKSDILRFGPQGRINFTGLPDPAHNDRLEIDTRSLIFNESLPYPMQFEIGSESKRSVTITAEEVRRGDEVIQAEVARDNLWSLTLTGAYQLGSLNSSYFMTIVGADASERLKTLNRSSVAWPQYTVAKLVKFHNRDPYSETNLDELQQRMDSLLPTIQVIESAGTIMQYYRLQNRIAARVDQFGHRANFAPRISLLQQTESTADLAAEFGQGQFMANLRGLIMAGLTKPSVDQSEIDKLAQSVANRTEEQAEFVVSMDKLEDVNRQHHVTFTQLQEEIKARQSDIARSTQEEIEKAKTAADIKRGFAIGSAVVGTGVAIAAGPEAGAAVGAGGTAVGSLVYANSTGKVDLESIGTALVDGGNYYATMDKTFKAWDSFKSAQKTATSVLVDGKTVTVPDPTPNDKNHVRPVTKDEAARSWGSSAKDLFTSFYQLYQGLKPEKPTPLDLTKKEDADPVLLALFVRLADLQKSENKVLDNVQDLLGQQEIATQAQEEELSKLSELRNTKVVNDAEYERWRMAALSMWQSEIARASESVYTLNRAYFYATGRSIARTRQIADYFDEVQAALMTGLYDPTMMAEGTSAENVEKSLLDQQNHTGVALETTVKAARRGLEDYISSIAKSPDHFRDTYEFRSSDTDPQKAGFLRALNAQIHLQIALKQNGPIMIPLPVPLHVRPSPTLGPEWFIDGAITDIDFLQGANAVGASGLRFTLIHPGYGKLFRTDGSCSVFDMRNPGTLAAQEHSTPIGSIDPRWSKQPVGKIETQNATGFYTFYPLRTDYMLLVQVTSDNWHKIPEVKYLQIGLEELR